MSRLNPGMGGCTGRFILSHGFLAEALFRARSTLYSWRNWSAFYRAIPEMVMEAKLPKGLIGGISR